MQERKKWKRNRHFTYKNEIDEYKCERNDMNFLWSVLFLPFALCILTSIPHEFNKHTDWTCSLRFAHYGITHTISKSKIDERLWSIQYASKLKCQQMAVSLVLHCFPFHMKYIFIFWAEFFENPYTRAQCDWMLKNEWINEWTYKDVCAAMLIKQVNREFMNYVHQLVCVYSMSMIRFLSWHT